MVEFASCNPAGALVYLTFLSTTATSTLVVGFSGTTWVSWYEDFKPLWVLVKQDIMQWQWHQLDNMQIICTSLQADNSPGWSRKKGCKTVVVKWLWFRQVTMLALHYSVVLFRQMLFQTLS